MRFDELVLVSKRSTDVLGGLDATIIDALDTSMIMRKMA
jgi:Glycosyl hydrolase family 47